MLSVIGEKWLTYTNIPYGIVKFILNIYSIIISNIFCDIIPKIFKLFQHLLKFFPYFIDIS